MARNPLKHQVVCGTCGAKFRAGLRRCPRCRVIVAAPDPAALAASSDRLKKIAAGLAGAVALVLIVLWALNASVPAQPAAPPSSLAAPPRQTAPPANAPVAAGTERPFVDPPGMASMAYARGDMNAALAQYEEAVRRNPNDAESLSNLGQVLVRLNRAEESLPYFQRAIAQIPDRWAYHFNLARALGVLQRWNESVIAYRRAQELFPNDYATAFNLGLALRKAGDDAGAVAAFQKAIAIDPNEPTFRMALAMTYERLKQPAEAAAAYEDALRLAPQAPDGDLVRQKVAQLRATQPPQPPSGPNPPGGL
jgi:tetratricopeptide (TPR) repeat protein